jgi:hypothetical protein
MNGLGGASVRPGHGREKGEDVGIWVGSPLRDRDFGKGGRRQVIHPVGM